MNKITQEDLVQYLYHETSERKTAAIRIALENDWQLRESFDQIYSAFKKLEKIALSPREATINAILKYTSRKAGQLYPH